jgi:hypothetical protein
VRGVNEGGMSEVEVNALRNNAGGGTVLDVV